ncbi:syndecan-like [Penaeus chinensis]|uniref:Syndecan n=1 Tax=Penaeus chinensis TaxID=139456 RepID=A0A0A0PDJ1_PENCE|nr:syndecan-like [Penaeus chinensis]AHG99212.1 syndecan [Penaeus chinensis]
MRIYIAIGLIVLLGPVSQHKVSADLYGGGDRDLYWEDYGSGDGPELTHVEGSGHGTVGRGPYDTYDDTEDDYDELYDVHADKDEHDEETAEGSGTGGFDIDDEEVEDVYLPKNRPTVEEDFGKKEHPIVDLPAPTSTTPQPTYTEGTGMDTIQIHTTKTDDRQVSIFAQPGILAAFIGGAVVGLLCAILLVMFIVYRMRKKDEGSYPLDEPKRMPLTSSYSPNDKEIYA